MPLYGGQCGLLFFFCGGGCGQGPWAGHSHLTGTNLASAVRESITVKSPLPSSLVSGWPEKFGMGGRQPCVHWSLLPGCQQ